MSSYLVKALLPVGMLVNAPHPLIATMPLRAKLKMENRTILISNNHKIIMKELVGSKCNLQYPLNLKPLIMEIKICLFPVFVVVREDSLLHRCRQ